MLKVVADGAAREDLAASLDEIVREGAWRSRAFWTSVERRICGFVS